MVQDIENYLKDIMENSETVIEMSDSPIGSTGARCVSAAVPFCS